MQYWLKCYIGLCVVFLPTKANFTLWILVEDGWCKLVIFNLSCHKIYIIQSDTYNDLDPSYSATCIEPATSLILQRVESLKLMWHIICISPLHSHKYSLTTHTLIIYSRWVEVIRTFPQIKDNLVFLSKRERGRTQSTVCDAKESINSLIRDRAGCQGEYKSWGTPCKGQAKDRGWPLSGIKYHRQSFFLIFPYKQVNNRYCILLLLKWLWSEHLFSPDVAPHHLPNSLWIGPTSVISYPINLC